MVEKAPLAVKAYNKHIEFMGNHFNAGIKLGKGKFGKVLSLVAPLLLLCIPTAIRVTCTL
jgi:hypothetical protein